MTDPYEHGLLDVGDGHRLYWECCGNPDGIPALMVHGGPGSGCSPGMRDAVDLTRHRLILFDQRGCGRSLPHAADPATGMDANTTGHLVADMERLREHLGVRRWMLTGGSWGSTLILAYAQRHPDRVAGVVISGVTTSRRAELEWLYRGAGRFFPAEQQRFRAHVPDAGDDHVHGDDRRDPGVGVEGVVGDDQPQGRLPLALQDRLVAVEVATPHTVSSRAVSVSWPLCSA